MKDKTTAGGSIGGSIIGGGYDVQQERTGKKAEMVATCVLAVAIPAVLVMSAVQTRRYESLVNDVSSLERKQEALIEDNKRLVTDISVLSSSSRVEEIASRQLMMHKADSEEIIRVELGGR